MTLEFSFTPVNEIKAKPKMSYKKSMQKLKQQAMNILGGKCTECGYTNINGLQADHINSDGYKDNRGAYTIYRYVRDNPVTALKEFQCLCATCNMKKTVKDRITRNLSKPEEKEPIKEILETNPFRWNTKDIERLKIYYPHTLKNELLNMFPRSWRSIQGKALRLGISRDTKEKPESSSKKNRICIKWTEKDKHLLRKLYPDNTKSELLRVFHPHSWSSIRTFACRLNIVRRKKSVLGISHNHPDYNRLSSKALRDRNKDNKTWKDRQREVGRKSNKAYHSRHKNKKEYKENLSINQKKHRQKLWFQVLDILGDTCATCKKTEGLVVDHIHGGGTCERDLIGCDGIYRKIRDNPKEAKQKYQILCANCNEIKRIEKGEH